MVMSIFAKIFLISSLLLAAIESLAVPTGRIVGGINANTGEIPHQISLRFDNVHVCGGSIITNFYIVTAAHCVARKPASNLTVHAGSIDRLKGGVLIQVETVIIHPEHGNSLNDIALLKLQQPLIFSDYIKPVKVTPQPVPAGETVQISGWGYTYYNGENPIILQTTNATIVSRAQCRYDTDKIVCLASPDNRGACNGDSGGPATYKGTLVGVLNFTFFRCGTDSPDAYAQVSSFYDWILENTDLSEFVKENIDYQ